MNGDYILADRLIKISKRQMMKFRQMPNHQVTRLSLSIAFNTIANEIQELLNEYNPPKAKKKGKR
jgi:hypothetical protein